MSDKSYLIRVLQNDTQCKIHSVNVVMIDGVKKHMVCEHALYVLSLLLHSKKETSDAESKLILGCT